MLTVFGACIFAAGGSWTWFRGWAGLAVCFVSESVANGILAVRAPQTLNHRGTPHADVRSFDVLFGSLYLLLSVVLGVVIGVDCVRFEWSSLPWSTFQFGACLMAAATVIGTWAMLENDHFEQFVRIQSDRQHRVVTSGPYRVVRHPGYLAAILGVVAGPLLFGSIWASIPAMLIMLLLVWRTQREDTTLRDELEGYLEYTERTPSRLIPFIW